MTALSRVLIGAFCKRQWAAGKFDFPESGEFSEFSCGVLHGSGIVIGQG